MNMCVFCEAEHRRGEMERLSGSIEAARSALLDFDITATFEALMDLISRPVTEPGCWAICLRNISLKTLTLYPK